MSKYKTENKYVKGNGVLIPKNVNSVWRWDLPESCDVIETIEVEEGNPRYYSEGNCLINRETRELVLGCNRSVIPHSVFRIGPGAFSGCTMLRSVVLPKNLLRINRSAFARTSLSSVTFPPYLTAIDEDAFTGCTHLTEVVLPDSVSKLGPGAFRGCTDLKTVTLSKALTKIPRAAFRDCVNLERVEIPDNVTAIAELAFCKCEKLNSVKLPSGLEKIRRGAFHGCKSLTDVTIPYGVAEIQEIAFANCSNLQRVVIPSSVTKIHTAAFWGAPDVILYGAGGSYAEEYARRNHYPFREIEESPAFHLYCPACGTKLVKKSNFCHHCGEKVTQEEISPLPISAQTTAKREE